MLFERGIDAGMLLTALKAALGAAVSIVLAGVLGLSSPMTAGIICVLSIQTTKRATWRLAAERVLAFVCATVIAMGCCALLGYTLYGFTLYLFLYAVLCICLGWMHALTTISVLVTHYVLSGGITPGLVVNEALLLLIGAGVGMLVNLHLRPKVRAMNRLAEEMDECMIAALNAVADCPQDDAPFDRLRAVLDRAEHLAAENRDNRIFGRSDDVSEYVLLRKSQFSVLTRMRSDMLAAAQRPVQYGEVCALLHAVAAAYHRDNDVEALLHQREAVLDAMKHAPLPVSREEFESRAVLYNVLLRLEDFLRLKNAYARRRQLEQLH